eukprot:SAG11_NODE_1508_length_4775_cov_1.760693_6_plen_53_part_00
MAYTEEEYDEILSAESFVALDKLAAAARSGIPPAVRGEVWKYLLSVQLPTST